MISFGLIILFDVTVGLIEYILVLDLILDPDNAAESLLDFLLACGSALPAIKADDLYDIVDILNDTFDDYRCALIADSVEEFGQSGDTFIYFLNRDNFLFSLYSFLCKIQQELQELDAGNEALLMLFTELF